MAGWSRLRLFLHWADVVSEGVSTLALYTSFTIRRRGIIFKV